MISVRTVLRVFDNSGAKRVRCFKVFKKFTKTPGKVCDFTLVSIRKKKLSKNFSLTKSKRFFFGIIVNTKTKFQRLDGSTIKFKENGMLLLNQQKNYLGNNIQCLIPYELKKKVTYNKIFQKTSFI